MAKTDITVDELVRMIEHGQLRLPELQRRYIWPATRVRDLLDSLYRNYPSGSILAWQADDGVPEREMAVAQQARSPFGWNLLLLDGQQRLTSLSAVVRGEPLRFKHRVRPVEIAFNLEHPEGPPSDVVEVEYDSVAPEVIETEEQAEEDQGNGVRAYIRRSTFVVASGAVLADPRWVKVSDIFDPNKSDYQLIKPMGIGPEDPRFDKYAKRLQRVRAIKQYQYVMHVLERDLSYEEVAEIFVRVNSLGMKLRGSDLALAQISARWPNSLDLFEDFQAECERYWFNLDIGLFIRTLVVFATQQSRFATVSRIPLDSLQRAWNEAKAGLRFAVNFVRQNGGIENEALLSSPYFLIVVAVLFMLRGRELTQKDQRQLLHWLFVANALAHYSGSSETRLDADLAILYHGGGPGDLLGLLQQQFGRIRFNARDFAHRSWRHPLFSTAFLALRHRGAFDWGSGLKISLTHQGKSHWIESHHIFPNAVLASHGYERSEISEIANLAFVSGAKNRALGTKGPAAYFPTVVESKGRAELRDHAIPVDPELWKVENYARFLEVRRQLLAEAVNEFLDWTASDGTVAVDPVALIDGGENDLVEFKETLRWNVRSEQVDKSLEAAVAKTIAGFLNSRGGTLFIGVTDDRDAVGLDRDLRTLGRRQDADGFEQFLRQLLVRDLDAVASTLADVSFPVVDDQVVCMVRVAPSPEPVYTKDGSDQQTFHVRNGNRTDPLSIEDAHRYIDQHFR